MSGAQGRKRFGNALPAITGTGVAASLALALLVMVCAFAAVAVPRASLGYRTAVLQRAFHGAPSQQTTVLADAFISGITSQYLSAEQLAATQADLAAGLRHGGLPMQPPSTQWVGITTTSGQLSGANVAHASAPATIELLYRSNLAGNATLVAGSLPDKATTRGQSPAAGRARTSTFQVAVSKATATRFRLHVGMKLTTAGQTLVVTGIVQPRRTGSSFWTVDPLAPAPQLVQSGTDAAPYYAAAAFVGPDELNALEHRLSAEPLRGVWSFPLALGGVDADQAAGLNRALAAIAYLPAASTAGTMLNAEAGSSATITVALTSGVQLILGPFTATDDAVQRTLSLLFVSLAVIAAVVVLLGARLVTEHRRAEFTMMRARGASLRQVATVALAGGAAAALPAAAVGVAAAIAVTPGPSSVLSWWLAGLIIAAALAGPPALAVWWHRTRRKTAAASGSETSARRRIAAARRWIFDGALVAAAVAGLVVLRQQGLPPPGSIDLFTSAAPVLVAIPVALVVVRLVPPLLRQLGKLAGRRRGVVLVVGLARGGAATLAGVLPTFALVLAFAVIAFATMARGAVQRADETAAWQAAGADAVVTAPDVGAGITAGAQQLIARVPGVQRFATLATTQGTSGQGLAIPVVVVDAPQYAALTAGTPVPTFPAAELAPPRPGAPRARVPVLLSVAGRVILNKRASLYAAGRQLLVRVAGTLNTIPGVLPGSQFVVVPRWALGARAPTPTVMTIAGPHLDAAALTAAARHAVPGAQVTLRSHLLAAISGAPLPHGGFVTFAQGTAAAAGFSLLVLALMLVLSARSRELTMARLVTMGLGPAQSQRITVVEILPAILAATIGGTVCALALVPLVGPAIDLAAFAGAPVVVPLRAQPLAIVAAAAGLLVLGLLTLTVQNRLARSRGAAQALRVGQ